MASFRMCCHRLKHIAKTTSLTSAPGMKHFSITSQLKSFLDARDKGHEKKEKELIVRHGKQYFDEAAQKAKNKEAFQGAITAFLKTQGRYRRGLVEFVYSSLDHMEEFGVNQDLDTYKKVLWLFPQKVMVPSSVWQIEMMHYPKQQQCLIDLLEHMEENGVVPDDAVGYQLIDIFGDQSHVFRRYRRMMYWMPKFKNINPYFIPQQLPNDKLELALMALKRMSVDVENSISVFHTEELESCSDRTFIASGQSPQQRSLLADHPPDRAVFVEGAYTVWLRSKSLTYFVLRSDVTQKFVTYTEGISEDTDDTKFEWNFWEDESQKSLVSKPSVHEQEDGTILAMCITGSSSKDSLVSWVKFLERTNPKLATIPVVFLLKSSADSDVMLPSGEDSSGDMTKLANP